MFSRVSTYSNHMITIDSLNRRQSSLAELQRDISSGVQYDTFGEIAKAGQTRRVVDFNSSLNRIDTFQRNNEIMRTRLEVMDKNIGSIEDLAKSALAVITQERSAVGDVLPLAQELRALLQQVEDRLNASAGGRYVFAGAATDTRPVASLQTSNLDGSNVATDNYYLGDGTDLSQRVDEDVTVAYGIRANDTAFQQLIAGFHLAIKAENNGSDAQLATAFDTITEALKDTTGLRNNIGNSLTTLEGVNADHENFKAYYKNTLGEVIGTDIAEATIQLSLDQAVLQASFQAFARVSGLTLSQYLR